MHNPPHPREFMQEFYIRPFDLSIRSVAKKLGISPSTLTRLLNGQSRVTPGMTLRLSKLFGRSPESWLALQDNYSLWEARQPVDVSKIE